MNLLNEIECRILSRHEFKPKNEIYHLANNVEAILAENILRPKCYGMLSFTANPFLTTIFPETSPRKYRLVLDFKALKRNFGIFPVYYYTEEEFYNAEPYRWLVKYYVGKGLSIEDVETWNGSIVYVSAGEPMGHESEWKSLKPIEPLDRYLIRVERIDER